MFGWKLHNNGILVPGAVVAPTERLGWGRTIGLGAQHVVAMFGATFVFPLLMGLNPQLAVMMSGIATLVFLFVVKHRVPSYLGSSASFVGVATAIYSAGGNPATLSGALFVVGLTLFMVGLIIHFAGARVIHKTLPPVVTGAVVMLIGFNLAPVVAETYWPQDPWLAFIVMLIVIALSVGLRGFLGRIAIFLSLVAGYVLSWIFDLVFGPMRSADADGTVTEKMRVDWSAVEAANWFGLPPVTDLANWRFGGTGNVVGFHLPQFSLAAIIIALPVVIALIAENAGHVKAVAEMTGENLDPLMGRAVAAERPRPTAHTAPRLTARMSRCPTSAVQLAPPVMVKASRKGAATARNARAASHAARSLPTTISWERSAVACSRARVASARSPLMEVADNVGATMSPIPSTKQTTRS
mgnify:CR=1 FL=1